jgi:hypothetical protein
MNQEAKTIIPLLEEYVSKGIPADMQLLVCQDGTQVIRVNKPVDALLLDHSRLYAESNFEDIELKKYMWDNKNIFMGYGPDTKTFVLTKESDYVLKTSKYWQRNKV